MLLAPYGIIFLLTFVGPFFFAIWLSLHDWNGFSTFTFVGSANYERLFSDPSAGQAAFNSTFYVGGMLAIVIPVGLAVALMVNSPRLRGRDLIRTGFLLPASLAGVTSAIFFSLLFENRYGIINAALSSIFGPESTVDWIQGEWTARFSVLAVVAWRAIGLTMLLFVAGLQNISSDQREAAVLDGAGSVRIFQNVTLPGLRPVTFFVIAISFISASQVFEEPLILTGGGPNGATRSYVMYITKTAFNDGDYGYAAAQSIAMLLVMVCIAVSAFAWSAFSRAQKGGSN